MMMLRKKRRGDQCGPDLPHVRRGHFLSSDLLAAIRRVERRRAEARAVGNKPPTLEPRGMELRRRGRVAGMLGRRRMVTVNVTLSVSLIERVLWLSGARTVQDAVELALLKMVLDSPAGGARRRQRFLVKKAKRRILRNAAPAILRPSAAD